MGILTVRPEVVYTYSKAEGRGWVYLHQVLRSWLGILTVRPEVMVGYTYSMAGGRGWVYLE